MVTDEVKLQALKASPAVAGAAASYTLDALTAVTWSNIVAWCTVAYIILQAYFLIRDKWWRDSQRKPRRKQKAD